MPHTPDFQPRGSRPRVSNTERQRQFRERNPDYYRLLKAKERARSKAVLAEYRAREAFTARVMAELTAKSVLMLPAPVECPLTAEINAMRARLAAREAEPVLRAA